MCFSDSSGKVILYHGTTYDTLNDIISCGVVKITDDYNSPYPNEGYSKTQRGFLYLTDDPLTALEFASNKWQVLNGNGRRLLVVLKLSVYSTIIESDPDEKRKTYTREKAECLRTADSIPVDGIKSAAFFEFSSFNSCCECIDAGNTDSIIWSTFDNIKWNGDVSLMSNNLE